MGTDKNIKLHIVTDIKKHEYAVYNSFLRQRRKVWCVTVVFQDVCYKGHTNRT